MRIFVCFALLFVCSVSTFAQTMPKDVNPQLWARALKIHKKAVIVDGHNDVSVALLDEGFDYGTNTLGKFRLDGVPFHTDLNRFKQSGITGEFFALPIVGNYIAGGSSARRALDLLDATMREIEKYPNQFAFCTTAAEIRRAKKQNKVCALLSIEGGHAIEDSLPIMRDFYRLGVRSLTITHNNTNNWADGCCSAAKHNGLSGFGKEVVREMNRLGMIIDLSHASDDTSNDVLDVSTAPVIYSHSCARKFSDHKRNVPDDLLKRVAQNKGLVMVTFVPAFLDQRHQDESRARDEKLKPEMDALRAQFKDDRAALGDAMRKLLAANPIYNPSYAVIVDHIDHIKQVAGIDYVGFGSSYDGAPLLPEPMQGAEDLVLITYEMLRRGYSEQDVLKVLGGNFLRAFEQTEQVAKTNTRRISADGSLKKIQ